MLDCLASRSPEVMAFSSIRNPLIGSVSATSIARIVISRGSFFPLISIINLLSKSVCLLALEVLTSCRAALTLPWKGSDGNPCSSGYLYNLSRTSTRLSLILPKAPFRENSSSWAANSMSPVLAAEVSPSSCLLQVLR